MIDGQITEVGTVVTSGAGWVDVQISNRSHPSLHIPVMRRPGFEGMPPVGSTVTVLYPKSNPKRSVPVVVGMANNVGLNVSFTPPADICWHNGVDGTPDYTGSLYSLDTGYRKWKPDAGWSIPGPWDAIIGYTVDQGYILTVRGKDVRCYLAETGAPAWEYELPQEGSSPVYNPARREVVFLDTKLHNARVDAILEATTGHVLAGSQTLPRGTWFGRSYRVFLWGDRLYDIREHDWSSNPGYSRIWARDGAAGYVLTGTVAWTIPDLPWGSSADSHTYYSIPYHCAFDGQAVVRIGGARGSRAWTSIGLLDMSTSTHTVTDVIYGPEMLFSIHANVEAMSPDGFLYGNIMTGHSYLAKICYQASWSPGGTRLHTGPVEDGWVPSTFFLPKLSGSGLAAIQDRATGVQSITQNLSILWSLPSGDRFTGYGGESTRGEDPWILVSSPGGWHFRDFRTGAVLGPWAGSRPVMISAGIIYNTDTDGNLRRWT